MAVTDTPYPDRLPSAHEILERGRAAVEADIRAAVSRLHPTLEQIAAYHLGWDDDQGRGKALRPVLAVLSAEAAGADAAVAAPGAVAVELVHASSLLHDDILDDDRTRHHRPAAWVAFGVGPAILAGDALLNLAHTVLAESPSHSSTQACRMLLHSSEALLHGQAEDLVFENRPTVTVEEYLAMSARKTGALLGTSAAVGACLANAPAPLVKALESMGQHLGLGFQAVDDLLGIWGDPARTGKPVFGDLRQRKKSLPITAALAADHPAARHLARLLATGPSSEQDLQRAADLVDEGGGRDATLREADRQLDQALEALNSADMVSTARAELTTLITGLAHQALSRWFKVRTAPLTTES
ncbi:polyprenyl synthetase family protein [Streptomyces sp. NPDC087263]|uniref:polyprenyl synthetase family protein n=1 Tax=Streptomyces sp. NPDC087263 TaxID=3365773 RepID=UPI00382743B2